VVIDGTRTRIMDDGGVSGPSLSDGSDFSGYALYNKHDGVFQRLLCSVGNSTQSLSSHQLFCANLRSLKEALTPRAYSDPKSTYVSKELLLFCKDDRYPVVPTAIILYARKPHYYSTGPQFSSGI